MRQFVRWLHLDTTRLVLGLLPYRFVQLDLMVLQQQVPKAVRYAQLDNGTFKLDFTLSMPLTFPATNAKPESTSLWQGKATVCHAHQGHICIPVGLGNPLVCSVPSEVTLRIRNI